MKSLFPVCIFLIAINAQAVDFSGRLALENRLFTNDNENQISALAEPEWYWSLNDKQSLTFKPFVRFDALDDERSHTDIRELLWLYIGTHWEFRAGIGKVFWGVTESQHLVDVINQTDFVESSDGEEKLGQTMLQFSWIRDWGVIDAFVLPSFRERSFAGIDGRLSGPLLIDQDNAEYESSRAENHTDYAFRWSHSLGDWDLGLSYFNGTNRIPQLQLNSGNNGEPQLTPFYDQSEQWGLDLQATLGFWLWKLESIAKKDSIDDFTQVTAGFEYTLTGIASSSADLGLLMEYSNDTRPKQTASFLQNDIFIGARLALNDVQSSVLLLGLAQDLENSDSYFTLLEASRRIGNNFKITVNASLFESKSRRDPVAFLKNDDNIEVSIEYFY